jgi:hypothetical protein
VSANQKGISLVQFLVSLMVMGLIVLAAGGIIQKLTRDNSEAQLQIDLDVQHAHLLQALGNTSVIRRVFSLSETGTSALTLCLKGGGSGCSSQQTPFQDLKPVAFATSDPKVRQILGACLFDSTSCPVEQTVMYRWSCPEPNWCSELQMQIRTKARLESSPLHKERVSELSVPGGALLSRSQISFACAQSSLVQGLNYRKLQADCGDLPGTNSTSGQKPLATYAGPSVEAITNDPGETSCAMGIASLSLMGSATLCLSGGSSSPGQEVKTVTKTEYKTECESIPFKGRMCAGPITAGQVFPNTQQGEQACLDFCRTQQVRCCSFGTTSFNPTKGYCFASMNEPTNYNNNFAQLSGLSNLYATSLRAVSCNPKTTVAGGAGSPPPPPPPPSSTPDPTIPSQNAEGNFEWKKQDTVCGTGPSEFIPSEYLALNPDVAAACNGDVACAIQHWQKFGSFEGRNMRASFANQHSSGGDDGYLLNYPDVFLAGVNPWGHYQNCGAAEGRAYGK